MTLLGLVAIGLPTVSFVTRRRLSTGIKASALALISTVAGGLIATLYFLLLAALAGSIEGKLSDWLSAAAFGLLPGLIVALVWIVINFDTLGPKRV